MGTIRNLTTASTSTTVGFPSPRNHRLQRIQSPTRRWRVASVGAIGAIGAIALSGCTMVFGLAESTGSGGFTAQQASLDVLRQANIPVQLAPVCSQTGSGPITCDSGKTTSGETITVTVENPETLIITVDVAGKQIFNGSAIDVTNNAGRVDR